MRLIDADELRDTLVKVIERIGNFCTWYVARMDGKDTNVPTNGDDGDA